VEEFYLRFPAKMRYLHLATNLCRELCAKVPKKRKVKDFVADMELCISEACTNAIRHSEGLEQEAYTSVHFHLFIDRVVIQIGDEGEGFVLEDVPAPDLNTHPERGYGLYIIKSIMDEVRYVRADKGNYLEMIKFFDKPFHDRSLS
jgi:serine/threonine-protein kinase RsbW